MHIISRKTLKKFADKHQDSKDALSSWWYEVKHAEWKKSSDIKKRYPTASIINAERVVFNICGNKYRVVVSINYPYKKVFIRFVGTHAEYDKIDVENI